MMNTLSIIVLLVVVGMTWSGYRKGFVKTAVPFVASLLSLLFLWCMKEWLFVFLFKWTIFGGEHLLARVVVIVLSYLLGYLLFRWLFLTLKIFTKLPIIHGLDKVLGCVAGFILAMLMVGAFFCIVSWSGGILFGWNAMESIQGNEFLKFLFENNILSDFMDGIYGIS